MSILNRYIFVLTLDRICHIGNSFNLAQSSYMVWNRFALVKAKFNRGLKFSGVNTAGDDPPILSFIWR